MLLIHFLFLLYILFQPYVLTIVITDFHSLFSLSLSLLRSLLVTHFRDTQEADFLATIFFHN